jgi:hypothetical protein
MCIAFFKKLFKLNNFRSIEHEIGEYKLLDDYNHEMLDKVKKIDKKVDNRCFYNTNDWNNFKISDM